MPDGGYVVADLVNSRVRRVFPDGRIVTIAGTGTDGYNGDSRLATTAQLNFVHGVAAMPDADVVIADDRNHRIRRVDSTTGLITTVAGTGTAGYNGDGTATAAQINNPRGLATTPDGSILIADTDNHVVRRVDPAGTITTVAGTPSTPGFDGDDGPATSAKLNKPFAVAPAAGGALLIADANNNVIRRVAAPPDGKITTVAGTAGQDPSNGPSGDGGSATQARMYAPHSVVETPAGGALPGGGFLIAEFESDSGNRIRFVSPQGTISTVAGTGTAGSTGDGGQAAAASLNGPRGLSIRADGSFLIAEFGPVNFFEAPFPPGGDRIRFVTEAPAPLQAASSLPASSLPTPPSGTTLPTIDQIEAALRADLAVVARDVRQLGIGRLVRRRAFTARGLDALLGGRFSVTLTGTPSGTGVARKVVLAKGSRSVSGAGRYTFKVKLTLRGRRLLRSDRRAKVTLGIEFRDTSGRTTTKRKLIRMRR